MGRVRSCSSSVGDASKVTVMRSAFGDWWEKKRGWWEDEGGDEVAREDSSWPIACRCVVFSVSS